MKIAVIGIGGTGSAALLALARQGHQVTGFERFDVGHNRGSSHGASRIIRYAYADALYSQMMRKAFPMWEQLCRTTGLDLLVPSGGITFATAGNPVLLATEHALVTTGVNHILYDGGDAQKRFPMFKFDTQEQVIFHADAGFLRSSAIIHANTELAKDAGAIVTSPVCVTSIETTGKRPLLTLDNGQNILFDKVIVASGAYLHGLVPSLNLRLSVTRQQVTYAEIGAETSSSFEPTRMPVWIDAATNWYGIPRDSDTLGVKIARHHLGPMTDPISGSRDVSEVDTTDAISVAEARLHGLTGMAVYSETCLYTNTKNEDFLIDTLPGTKDVLIVSGCSGHGFKFTILLGSIAAEWAESGELPFNHHRFSLKVHSGDTLAIQ